MPRPGAQFPNRLVQLGLPVPVAGGFAADGPFWALFKGGPADLRRYLGGGEATGQHPSLYFDPDYYKSRNDDWHRAGTALGHYLLCHVQGEERPAHPLFDAAEYARFNPDLAQAGAASLLHFAQYGDAEGRRPSVAFDAEFYRRLYLPFEATDAFAHYLCEGRAMGALPRAPRRAPGALRGALNALCGARARPVLVACHDARQAGAPMLTLALVRGLRARGWDPVVLLETAGPLLARLRAEAPVVVLSEGWAQEDLAGAAEGAPVIALTVHMAALAARMAPGRRVQLLVQEMPDYWRAQGLEPDLRAAAECGVRVVMSFPAMADAFARVAPGHGADVLRPGLIAPDLSCEQRLSRARALRADGPVIIGAGYADQRKGFDLFLDTAARIRAALPQARFVWLGGLSLWARAQAERAMAAGLPLSLPGFVDDSHAWYAAASLFLLCSRQDPGPYVLADALSQGVPFVGFDADLGLRADVLAYGPLVPAGDTARAAQVAVTVMCQDSPAERRARRRRILAEAGFAPYLDAIEAGL